VSRTEALAAIGGKLRQLGRITSQRPGGAVLFTVVVQGALIAGCGDDARVDRTSKAPESAQVEAQGAPVATPAAAPLDYAAPPDSLIPNDARGASIRRGLALFTRTTDSLPALAPGNIQCASCHVDAGRRHDAAALIGVTARYPRYMERADDTVSIEDRVNNCFVRSLAGTPLAKDGRDMRDMVAYLAFLSTGVPQGAHVKGESMPKMPALSGDSARGAQLFATTCALCHHADGQGQPPAIPALWGPTSYSIGASMAREERAASFIRHQMPQSNRGSLTDQQAYDLAAFVNSHARPDTPGKEKDWPKGRAPADVPYNTAGHTAHRPPARLTARLTGASR
jgi:thiosulfate dehydrogenase